MRFKATSLRCANREYDRGGGSLYKKKPRRSSQLKWTIFAVFSTGKKNVLELTKLQNT